MACTLHTVCGRRRCAYLAFDKSGKVVLDDVRGGFASDADTYTGDTILWRTPQKQTVRKVTSFVLEGVGIGMGMGRRRTGDKGVDGPQRTQPGKKAWKGACAYRKLNFGDDSAESVDTPAFARTLVRLNGRTNQHQSKL